MRKNIFTLSAAFVMLALLFSCSTQKIGSNNGYNFGYHKPVNHTPAEVVKAEAVEEVAVVENAAAAEVPQEVAAPVAETPGIVAVTAADAPEVVATVAAETLANAAPVAMAQETKVQKSTKKSVAKSVAKAAKKSGRSDVPVWALYLLCFLIPFVAVGFATNWDVKPIVFNLLWSLLCGFPGIIHAIIVVARES